MVDSGSLPALPVLAVDDEEAALASCRMALASGGIDNVVCCQDSRRVMEILAEREVGVLLLDLFMPHVSGQELLPRIAESHPEIPIIIFTAANELETAVACMRAGATDYMVKPVESSRMVAVVRRVIELRELREDYSALRHRMMSEELQHPEAFAEFVTNNSQMKLIFRYVETIARTQRPVLITGETGVGKELVARIIHQISGRPGEFVALNAAGLDDNMFSDTLFGHTRGAYTGALEARSGLTERAAAGTLFLDEIGDLGPATQVKLLRLLQEREYFPLGADVPKQTDARVVAATHSDIDALKESGSFRKDLYYRLDTHRVHLPPLRERADDLPLLLDHFLQEAARSLGKEKPTPPRELLVLLGTYSFPGNVRELQSMVFDAVSRHTSRQLSMDAFKERMHEDHPRVVGSGPPVQGAQPEPFGDWEMLPTLKQAAELLIAEAMRRAQNNQAIAARLLGISRPALNRRLRRTGE